MVNQYLADTAKVAAESTNAYSNQQYEQRRMLGYDSDDKAQSRKSPMFSLSGVKSQK